MRSLGSFIVRVWGLADIVVLAACVAATWQAPDASRKREYLTVLLIVPLVSYLLRYFGLYESHRVAGLGEMIRPILAAEFLALFAFAHWMAFIGILSKIEQLLMFAVLSTAVLIVPRLILMICLRYFRARGFDLRRVCVVGSWDAALDIQQKFAERPAWGLEVTCAGLQKDGKREYVSFPDHEPVSDTITGLLRQEVIDEVIIVVPQGSIGAETETVHACEQHGLVARFVLRSEGSTASTTRVESFLGEASLAMGKKAPKESALLAKRCVDIVLSAVALILFAPLLILIAMMVKLSSPGPIIFRQARTGLNGREFAIYKFRTMVRDAEQLLPAYAKRNVVGDVPFKDEQDFRVTPLGWWLRKTSLDELPQLFNVLRGEMSLVGPRPLPVHEAAVISAEHRRRFSMKPGITCLWQVNGRSTLPFREWMKYDIQYVDDWSMWLDTKLLLRTIPAVLSGRGAH